MTWVDTEKGRLEFRELKTIEEMIAAEVIQSKVWGADIIVHPKEILIPIQREGGFLAGAFSSSNEMVGLIFGFLTKDPEVMHSQLLATLEEWRGQGIGTKLKWYQRSWCLERGFRLVHWTVDPLRSANAELNMRNLGGTASTYFVDYYGTMQGIDAGAPTDRLLVDWDIRSARIQERERVTPEDRGFPNAVRVIDVINDRPENLKLGLSADCLLLPLPANFVKLSKIDSGLALAWRLQTREAFLHYFDRGYAVTGFTRQGGPAYLLEKKV